MPDKELCLLALDGGGVKGLSALMILQQLMETINPESPPKPCDYFDMIGGTSTGGLIAIMLGRLKMNINECIDAYLSLSDRIFQKKRHRVKINGNIQGRFDSEELARAVKEVIAAQGLQDDTLLKDISENTCKVFVCATSKETKSTVCLASYRSPRSGSDLLNSVKIWEACRATSAASSFFDPIAIGPYEEEFVDGATGANNPIYELWNQAQLIWGPQQLEGRVKCLVSIGTGVPSLTPFQDDILHIGDTLVAIAAETEQTAERFCRDKSYLSDNGQYYRFNVNHGLEQIGLEESKKKKGIAAATRRYIESQGVFKQMQTCADKMARREYYGKYLATFSLEGVPRVKQFIGRPVEMAELQEVLLPKQQTSQQKIFVLHGLGGIGKTQLAVEFARQHHRKFSAVFWLDGRSEDTLKQSIASSASRISKTQISKPSKSFTAGDNVDINAIVREFMGWLVLKDNTSWLVIFDNVDRSYSRHDPDPDAYDIKRYFPSGDHGSILITTRQARLEQLGDSHLLGKVNQDQAEAILQSRYKKKYSQAERENLLVLLDGLPLAIAQAAAFLQESGSSITKYIEFYEQQWKELMDLPDWEDSPLQDYPNRSIWTTWTISYNAIRSRHVPTANLLLLWAFLDGKDLWYGLLEAAYSRSKAVATRLSEWIGDLAQNEMQFTKATQMLRNYSLIEDAKDSMSYATHPVVHKWAHYFQGGDSRVQLAQLAIMVVGWAVPPYDGLAETYTIHRRLLPHAHACSRGILMDESKRSFKTHCGTSAEIREDKESIELITAIRSLGALYFSQDKLSDAEKLSHWALQGYEKVLGPEHISTLSVIKIMEHIYAGQGKLADAEKMHQQALQGYEKAFGPENVLAFGAVANLGTLYEYQNRLVEAEQIYQQGLQRCEKTLGPEDLSTLCIICQLGILYWKQGKLADAETMFQRVLQGFEKNFGLESILTLGIISALGRLYVNQGKIAEAEKMYQRALQGYEKSFGADNITTYLPALNAISGLGNSFECQGDPEKARIMYSKALVGYEQILGPHNPGSQALRNKIHLLDL